MIKQINSLLDATYIHLPIHLLTIPTSTDITASVMMIDEMLPLTWCAFKPDPPDRASVGSASQYWVSGFEVRLLRLP